MTKKSLVVPAFLAALGLAGLPRPAAASPKAASVCRGVVNINEAPLSKLVLLPHIGKTKALAILRYRHKQPFHRASDLLKVRGIGKATFTRIKACIRVSGQTTIQGGKKGRRGRRAKSRRHRRPAAGH